MTHPGVDERAATGRAARRRVPRSSHGQWSPAPDRVDPVALVAGQNAGRLPWLVPLRHARMGESPFAFFRGAARVMAADLADAPVSGFVVQIGGDAHLANFGAYASPERRLVFDANDFDETLAGPWEWDLMRLAASFTIAARHIGLPADECRRVTARAVRAYRESIRAYGRQGFLEMWNDLLVIDDLATVPGWDHKGVRAQLQRFERKARSRDQLQALRKLTVADGGQARFRSDPPVLVPISELGDEVDPAELEMVVRDVLESYTSSLPDHRRSLVERFDLVDVALKVVGVGSVGTRCFVALLQGRDAGDPLLLQLKEATASVHEEHLGRSPYDHHGRRVVEGQRLAQAQSDIFLGWATGRRGHHYYVRQLRDWKGSADLDRIDARGLRLYAHLCGHTLARGHARSGDAVAIGAYAGKGRALDRAMVAFAEAYADQNEADHGAFVAAIEAGRIPVEG